MYKYANDATTSDLALFRGLALYENSISGYMCIFMITSNLTIGEAGTGCYSKFDFYEFVQFIQLKQIGRLYVRGDNLNKNVFVYCSKFLLDRFYFIPNKLGNNIIGVNKLLCECPHIWKLCLSFHFCFHT